jgi:anti-sigma regulatory factor (Ser/Thr protein kinase)
MIFEPDIEQLKQVQTFVEKKAQFFGLKERKIKQLLLAVEEVFVNIVQHGMQGVKKPIQISCSSDEVGFIVTLKDEGIAFNPLIVKIKETYLAKAPLEARKEGGLGLFFIRKFVDDLEYKYENGYNCLTLKQLK